MPASLAASRAWPSRPKVMPELLAAGRPPPDRHAIIARPDATTCPAHRNLEPGMSIVVRDVREHELDSVLALNNAAGPAILPLDAARLRHFFDHAEYFRVAERDGTLAGFLIGMGSTRRSRQQQLPLVPRALSGLLLHRPHRRRQPPPRRRRRPRVLRRRAKLRRAALPAAGVRGVPRRHQRPGAAVPWQLRLPRSRPARDARDRTSAPRC